MKEAQKYTKEGIKQMLLTNDKAVVRGILALYEKQTQDEKNSQATIYTNNVGFNGSDSKFLSSLAEWYKKTNMLTPKQIAFGRKKLLKYAGQLANIANYKASHVETKESEIEKRSKKLSTILG